MFRALGGNRPVGPACAAKYRAGARAAQYDGVLVHGWIFAALPARPSHKSLK
jgi:hypothetical protein